MITGKKIPVTDFDKGVRCARCGIFGAKTVCDSCSEYRPCSVCDIILKPETYTFYQYDYVQNPNTHKDRYYREIKKVHENAYSHNGYTCDDCKTYKENVKNECFSCGDAFENSPKRYRQYGNFCKDCTGENIEIELKDAIIIGDGLRFNLTE